MGVNKKVFFLLNFGKRSFGIMMMDCTVAAADKFLREFSIACNVFCEF